MSNSADVGDLENLGEKSYMTEKVNQLPSSPPEESPLQDDSSDHREDPEMSTSSPLEKETNVMTQGDLDRLREAYSFPAKIWTRIPEESKTILSTRRGEVAFYKVIFSASLRLPIHPTIRRILNFYNICPAQLSPNAWRCAVCVFVIYRFYRHHLSLIEFRCLYTLFKSPKPDSGWLYFKVRPRKNLIK